MSTPVGAKQTVSVASTETTILDMQVPFTTRLAIQLEPKASGQNLTARVKISLSSDATPSLTSFPDFMDPIPFGSSKVAFLDVEAASRVVVVGELDGAGGNVDFWVRED